MTRSLVLGNGRFLLNFDDLCWIRDVYYPYIGIENHSEGHAFRLGVWVDGATHWVDAGWDRHIGYEDGTLVGQSVLRSAALQLELELRDAVDFEIDVLCREIRVRDLAGRPRAVRVFLHHDFYISGTEVGDTALYDPELGSLIHYKRDRYFMMGGGRPPAYRLDGYAAGRKRIGGAEGTWRDAEGDGLLSGNAIAQGSVDSTLSLHVDVPASGEAVTYYWMAACERYGELLQIDSRVRRSGPAALIERTARYWQLWLESNAPAADGLPGDVLALYRTSLLVMRTHVDQGGAVIAATDSDITQFARDTYSYMWPRDGALAADAFGRAGYRSVAGAFFAFAAALIKREGYFLHKYHPDRSLASSWHPWVDERGRRILPIQEDETGLVVWALWRHFERFRDVEEVQPMYRAFIVRAAEFMAEYRDPESGLPLPSWDLWEERRGIFTFTCAAVWAGLDAASRFAGAFGDMDHALRFGRAAREVRDGILSRLWDRDAGRFLRMIVPAEPDHGLEEQRDATADASLFGLHTLGLLQDDDPRLVATLESIEESLAVDTEIGGTARYRGDYYHQTTDDRERVPGNPWFIAQCWVARWRIARADTPEALAAALEPLRWVVRRATPSRLLPEQLNPFTGDPLSVTPLVWSHAAFVAAVRDYLDRTAGLATCPECGATIPADAKLPMERALR